MKRKKVFLGLFLMLSTMLFTFLSATTSALAFERMQHQRTIVNPILLGLRGAKVNNARFAATPAPIFVHPSVDPVTVSSYQEYKHVMVNAMREKQKVVSICFSPNINSDEYDLWEGKLLNDCEGLEKGQLFKEASWIRRGYSQIGSFFSYQDHLISKVDYEIGYLYSSEEENSFEKELLQKEKEIISPEMNDYEREKAIHDWIVSNIKYSWDYFIDNGIDTNANIDYYAFKRRSAVSLGYSSLADRMFALAGITSQTIVGVIETPTNIHGTNEEQHSWNIVKICNNWYHVDTTLDSLRMGNGNDISYDYFNLSDDEIPKKISWDRKFYPTAPRPFDQNCERVATQPRCSLFHPELCRTEMACIRISGHWCNGQQCQMDDCSVVQPISIPTTQEVTELIGDEIANAPVYLGDIATGGNQMQFTLSFPSYMGPVDEYIAIQLPNGTLFFFGPNGFTTNVVAYNIGVTSAQRKTIYNPFDVYNNGQPLLSAGKWVVYSLVCPSNGGDLIGAITNDFPYDLLYYTFAIHP